MNFCEGSGYGVCVVKIAGSDTSKGLEVAMIDAWVEVERQTEKSARVPFQLMIKNIIVCYNRSTSLTG